MSSASPAQLMTVTVKVSATKIVPTLSKTLNSTTKFAESVTPELFVSTERIGADGVSSSENHDSGSTALTVAVDALQVEPPV